MQDQRITILLQAFDHSLLDQASKEIVNTVKRTGVDINGPIPLPVKIEKYTVKKSTHVFKEAQNQFEIRRHKRLLIIEYPNPQTVNALMKVDLAYGVDVEIKVGDS
ncbi:MAG: 30S ribosomal protein S10 [Rickettsiales bacterium]|nr:30S ribosomal protein S10 [Rickettsiales bacterium]